MIDARGLLCPEPVIRTKKELDKDVNEVETLVDNEVAVNNLKKLAESLGASATVKNIENYYSVKIVKGSGASNSNSDNIVVAISQDHMGADEELGKILIKSFIYTLTEAVHKVNACGLCLDFYKLKEDVQVGGITNMYDIYEKMADAGHLIRI